MQSHWDKLPTIRVVDAGYLLAGMEPERKWQFAPPLVKNLFNLIHEKTGAVKLATMPGERMEVTQAEFQALKAKYGVTPATELKAPPDIANPEQTNHQETPQYQAEYAKAMASLITGEIEKIEKSIKQWEIASALTVGELKEKKRTIAELNAKRDELQLEFSHWDSQQPAPAQSSAMPAPMEALETQRGYVLTLPSGQTHVQFGEVALLIANALWPDAGADDTRMTYGCTRVNIDAELVRAVKSGTLQVKDPLTFGPHTFPVGNALLSALVTVDDLGEFVAGRGLTVETAKTQLTTPNPAPVVSETVNQRRARYLAMFETEEKRDKRGALQRVADSEGIDRSNMKKDIDKARAARDAQKKAGGEWVSQLVQDGKRTG